MCGIAAIISKNNTNILPLLFSSINQLQNRGYDSIGFSFKNDTNNILFEKKAMSEEYNCDDFFNKYETYNSICAMAHTRWATHGMVCDENSHPHISFDNKVAIVHNGIIENYKEIKQKLLEQNKDITFKSETDSEVISNLIAQNLIINNNYDLAIKNTINKLQGTYGLCIMFQDTNNIYVVKNGSPLLIGENDDNIFISSETSGFCKQVNKYISLEPHDIISINSNGINTTHIYSKQEIQDLEYSLTPYPYSHWTLKEINEQVESIARAYNYGGRIRDGKVVLGGLSIIKNAPKNLILLGCGTSLHACQIAVYYFKKFKYFEHIYCYDGAEF